jgi:transmembrane sensor
MNSEEIRLQYLFSKYFEKTASAEEKIELANLVSNEVNREQIMQLFSAEWEKYQGDGMVVSTEKTHEMLQHILGTPPRSKAAGESAPVRSMFPWRSVAVAASIILMLGIGSYLLFFNKRSKPAEVANTNVTNDIKAPETNRAMITLANGKKILLDSLTSGTLAIQGNVNVSKTTDGQIIYNGSSTEEVFNTLYNPRGSKVVPLTLSDGTKVWLNNESSIRYPVAFAGNERKVEITGEAYFEVATLRLPAKGGHALSGQKMPFKVKINNSTEVEVLGTHFNINAFADEASINTTLLEGSVRVIVNKKVQLLSPGQQAQVNANAIRLIKDADVAQAVAWKNGLFSFTDANLPTVMRQLARWYGLDVQYEGAIPEREFNGKIGKTLTLDQALRVLAKTNVKYRIESGNKITIIN